LDLNGVIAYLIREKLIEQQSVVEGDTALSGLSRRNLNTAVTCVSAPSYFVKVGRGPSGNSTVAHEAKVYHVLLADRKSNFQTYLPALYRFDQHVGALTLEYLKKAETLRRYHLRLGRFPVSIAIGVGTMLARLHSVKFPLSDGHQNALFAPGPAWALSMHRPTEDTFHQISTGNMELLTALQSYDEITSTLDRLREEWQATTLIHHDLKWDNLLLIPRIPKKSRLYVVDWEFAGSGDPCWDVGSALAGYLSHWLHSMPLIGVSPTLRYVDLASAPLERMQPAIQQLWNSYLRNRNIDMDEPRAKDLLARSTMFCAVRLLQTAYEQLQSSHKMAANSVYLMQLSANILARPREAAIHLLGIPIR